MVNSAHMRFVDMDEEVESLPEEEKKRKNLRRFIYSLILTKPTLCRKKTSVYYFEFFDKYSSKIDPLLQVKRASFVTTFDDGYSSAEIKNTNLSLQVKRTNVVSTFDDDHAG